MKYLSLYIMAVTAIMLSACSKGSDNPVNPAEPVDPNRPVSEKVEIRISPTISDSRATDTGFETGDCVGLYVTNYNGATPGVLANNGNHVDNMRFTYTGSWVPDNRVYWADETTHADFYLYYPYSAVQSVTAHQFEVKTDQSTESAYKASDFMVGKASNVAPTASDIAINARHVMSRITITLEAGSGFTQQSLAASAISIKINGIKCGSTINLSTGSIAPTGNPVSVTPLLADGAYKALIVPQSVEEGNLITVTVDGRDFNLHNAFTFESGKNHNFTVTLSKVSTGVNVNINPWADDDTDHGGTAI